MFTINTKSKITQCFELEKIKDSEISSSLSFFILKTIR